MRGRERKKKVERETWGERWTKEGGEDLPRREGDTRVRERGWTLTRTFLRFKESFRQ